MNEIALPDARDAAPAPQGAADSSRCRCRDLLDRVAGGGPEGDPELDTLLAELLLRAELRIAEGAPQPGGDDGVPPQWPVLRVLGQARALVRRGGSPALVSALARELGPWFGTRERGAEGPIAIPRQGAGGHSAAMAG